LAVIFLGDYLLAGCFAGDWVSPLTRFYRFGAAICQVGSDVVLGKPNNAYFQATAGLLVISVHQIKNSARLLTLSYYQSNRARYYYCFVSWLLKLTSETSSGAGKSCIWWLL
jgi:hypothetical protein